MMYVVSCFICIFSLSPRHTPQMPFVFLIYIFHPLWLNTVPLTLSISIHTSLPLSSHQQAPAAEPQKTLESTREKDDTVVDAADEEVKEDEAQDEFSKYFNGEEKPKVLITTCLKPTKEMYCFIKDLLLTIPNSVFYKRRGFELHRITKEAGEKGFTDLIVLNENRKKFDGWTQFHLPYGPTAKFKVSNVILNKDFAVRIYIYIYLPLSLSLSHSLSFCKRFLSIYLCRSNPLSLSLNLSLSLSLSHHKQNRGKIQLSRPEVVLNNFNTRLGHRAGRMLGALFHQTPAFKGRRVVTFHNQRDFIFFRHHRYIFSKDCEEVKIQELGPQFTLKMQWLHSGLGDSHTGEFEWLHKTDMDTSRRRFFL